MNREAILSALFDQLLTTVGPIPTSGRRLLPWTKCPDQPALFLRDVADHYPGRRAVGLPAAVTLEAEVWLYNRTDDDEVAPAIGLNMLIDAVETALAPVPPGGAVTLGGLVQHVYIEGTIDKHPGDLDGQAIAVIPLRILVPS